MTLTVFVDQAEQTQQQQAFATLLEASFHRNLTPGQVVVGEITRIEKDYLVADIGGKCEGHVPLKEIPGMAGGDTSLEGAYHSGQITEFYVLRDFDDEQPYLLSLRRVAQSRNWDELSRLLDQSETLQVTVCATTRGGVLVQVLGLKGFIPASQLRVAKTLEALVGDTLPAKLLEVEKAKNKLILSHRAAVFEAQAERRQKTLEALSEGQVVEGEVVKITNFGAFVDIRGIDGLLPLSEISWRRLKHPGDVLALGQAVTVQVLTIDRALERISLSMKRLETDPWETVSTHFKEGDTVTGEVTKLLNSGFLAEIAPGIEAFCSYQRLARDHVAPEVTLPFRIVSVAAQDRRITLEPLLV